MKRFSILLLSLMAMSAAARTRQPSLPLRDEGRLAGVKRVALIAVYGPEHIYSGFSKSGSEQALYDAAEARVLDALRARGITVIAADTTKGLIESEFADDYVTNFTQHRRASGMTEEQFKTAIRPGYLVVTQGGKPHASANTHLFFGADYGWQLTSQQHQNAHRGGDNDSFHQPAANQDEPSRKALSMIAAKAGADAWVVVRVIPTMATTVAAEPSKWNPLGTIKKGMNAISAMHEGDHGFVTIDISIVDTQNTPLFQDQVIGMSKEAVGTGGGFNFTMKQEDMDRLTTAALDEAMPQLVAHLSGQEGTR